MVSPPFHRAESASKVALWLLLLSVLTHVLVPGGSLVQRHSGSALSASSADLALVSPRGHQATRKSQASDPDEEGLADPFDPEDLQATFAAAENLFPPPLIRPADEYASFASLSGGGAAAYQPRAPPSV